MTIRQPGDVLAPCPVCGAYIDLLNSEQVPRPANGSLEEHIETIVAANEALILQHAQVSHSIKDVMLALGTARQALLDIRECTFKTAWSEQHAIVEVIDRGLGGK